MIVSNYFDAVRDKWPNAWREPDEGQILARTTGFNALIRFLKDAYLSVVDKPRVVEKGEFAAIFQRINILEEDLNKESYVPGSSGQGKLYRELRDKGLPNLSHDSKQPPLI